MRESNFAFPAQNRACVCITSQLYDRRALDTNSPLPLLNSLTHLTYLTSTSPRIREILTCDGGLERLVRLLKDFCFSPPPPENPSAIFGLSPPSLPRPAQVPVLNPKLFDRHAAYRFSLAFQCVVNIGVRGSEPIRSRVVQAGTLDVVGCILEAWLASKGFAVGPSASASGIPRESREQRQLRRQQQLEQRQREQAQELHRLLALQRSLANAADEEQTVATSDAETTVSTDTSANATPTGSGTPTTTVTVPGRDRSGTVVARRVWDTDIRDPSTAGPSMSRSRTVRARMADESATPSTSTSRPETETEDDGEPDADGDVEMGTSRSRDRNMDENIPPPHGRPHGRRTVGIVTDNPSPAATAAVGAGIAGTSDALDVDMDAHIIINTNAADDGVADGIVALEQNVNDDLAMGAPPGAPGAIDTTPRTRTNALTLNTRNINMQREHHHHHVHGREELTPRAVLATLPLHINNHPRDIPRPQAPAPIAMPVTTNDAGPSRVPDISQLRQFMHANVGTAGTPAPAIAPTPPPRPSHRHHHHHSEEQGPYREDDVLLGLQLLAYLSKYPHVRQAFYKPRLSFHPATAISQGQDAQTMGSSSWRKIGAGSSAGVVPAVTATADVKKDTGFFKALTGRGKEKEKDKQSASVAPNAGQAGPSTTAQPRMTNVFSLVERFTFRPSPTESSLPQPPPFLPHDIQYWAGVIMRNACRKDESRGGIRQCANMLCGKWESFPREFAKCRRCRKAKYCGKECQSRAWSEGHRFWCSAREEEGEAGTSGTGTSTATGGASTSAAQQIQNAEDAVDGENGTSGVVGGSRATMERIDRRQARDRERQRMSTAAAAALAAMQPAPSASSAIAAARNPSTSSTETVMRGQASRPSGSNTSGNALYAIPRPVLNPRDVDSPIPIALLNQQQQAVRGIAGLPGAVQPFANGANELTFPLGLDLNGYSPEQQATIRTFLQAVGIAELEADNLLAPPPQGADASVPGAGDVSVEIEYHQRGRERERERPLPERIQAMNVADHTNVSTGPSSSSSSRSPRDGSTADMEMSEDDSMEVVD
ncbi:hypothetical protein A7U60_g3519 [Sanghuangporus baumii]|uniref:MYND-type domain-containing protein n=1 Tax=Sanghuangporus baumii TaxID=108892 RepID=A0A9Q5I0B8_SANBA|nr:hypothetical protein A7U60_g3519 [Sanghuangporus baumii]